MLLDRVSLDRSRERDEVVPVRIAMVGTRGVPARYGGFETAIEEVGSRLAARGHELHVVTALPWYRTHSIEPGWEGRLSSPWCFR